MSSKPESSFIRGVHKYLPPGLHFEKMNNPYSSGTPDVYYSGPQGDLWVEYKFLPALAVRANNKVNLSELQRMWLHGRHKEGRNVAVIVGCPDGGTVLRAPFPREISTPDIQRELLTRKQLAEWILTQTGPPDELRASIYFDL